MRILRALARRLRGMIPSHHAEADFSAELDAHLDLAIDEGKRAGLTTEEARRRALIRLGGAEQTRQMHRERRTLPVLEALMRDLRSSFRTLAKHPGITAIAILSIGLGIGANATIFSMVSRFILRPAPMGDPTTLLALHTTHDGDRCCNSFSGPLYADVRDQARSFSGVAAYNELIPASISGNGEPERVWGQGVSPNFFNVLQMPMIVGRGFTVEEANAPHVVLGSALWRRRFNSDPDIAGKSVMLSGRTFTVIGVAPPEFHGADQILYTEFWVPLGVVQELVPNLPDASSREFHQFQVLARLAPGVSRIQAAAELKALSQSFALSFPQTEKGGGIVFEQAGSLPSNVRGPVELFLTALTVVVLLVLAIAGANVANLMFAQAASRQRDMAVRLAVGATRSRLRRQVLMESLLLGLGGGIVGVILSLWSTRALSALHLPAPVPLDVRIAVDWRVLLFAFLLSVVSGVLLGMAPAWAASRPQLANALKGEDTLARPGRRVSLRNLLVVVQVGLSLVLLCLTGLFLRSLQSAAGIDIGFRPQSLLKMSIDPRVHGYTPERTAQSLRALQDRVATTPGVVSAVFTDVALLSDGNRSDGLRALSSADSAGSYVSTDLYMAAPGYFKTMGIPMLAGSDFNSETKSGVTNAIVSRAFVDQVFAGRNPIGEFVTGGGFTYRIIGVVGDVKSRTLGEDTRPVLFRSLYQTIADDPSLMGYTLIVKSAGNPAAVAAAVRQQIHLLDPALAIFNEETMEEHISSAFFLARLAATLFSVFGAIGLILAAIGLYGVMSYAVSRRTREIGIRMALGAESANVQRLILRQGLILTCIALALGWPAAWMLAKFASSFLYGIQPHDMLTFTLVPPFLAIIALFACWLPARRAAMVDPVKALRAD